MTDSAPPSEFLAVQTSELGEQYPLQGGDDPPQNFPKIR
jgi:hypothetical protein